ncbi:protein TMED8 isoform X1 [Gopherus evgoodei]|uniref:Transmembrane p24 trafficking protein family member 8 n=1 Tax=Gopherus evgoodei TaxID=1825980 RepID=A0A8C4VCJ2_9SAUR|nr:protein TMED8 isoform X1 [Gopherus evgoodei]
MSEVLVAAAGSCFEPPAAGEPGGRPCSVPEGDAQGRRSPPVPPSETPENEDSTPKPESASQTVASSVSEASQCRPPIGSPVNVHAAEYSRKGDGTSEDQDVARQGEKLADQIQPPREHFGKSAAVHVLSGGRSGALQLDSEAVVRMTKYRAPQGPGDIVMIQSEHTGAVDVLSAELETTDLLDEQRKAQPPPLAPPSTWTTCKIREFKAKMGKEKNAQMVVKRGEVVTVRVPTHPNGKRVCWEFATDDYDIGFGVYFDWTPVTSTAITVQVSESSDEEDEEEEDEIEGLTPVGDVERGSKSYLRNRYGEIMPVYRRDSHRDVQAGTHDYPGEGIYLLKFDNSYSLLRNKTLFFHVYYTS